MSSPGLRVRAVLNLEPVGSVVPIHPHLSFRHDTFQIAAADFVEELFSRSVDVLGVQAYLRLGNHPIAKCWNLVAGHQEHYQLTIVCRGVLCLHSAERHQHYRNGCVKSD